MSQNEKDHVETPGASQKPRIANPERTFLVEFRCPVPAAVVLVALMRLGKCQVTPLETEFVIVRADELLALQAKANGTKTVNAPLTELPT